MALLLNDDLELAIDDAGHRHTQELNALTEAHNSALHVASERAEAAECATKNAVRQHEQEMQTVKKYIAPKSSPQGRRRRPPKPNCSSSLMKRLSKERNNMIRRFEPQQRRGRPPKRNCQGEATT